MYLIIQSLAEAAYLCVCVCVCVCVVLSPTERTIHGTNGEREEIKWALTCRERVVLKFNSPAEGLSLFVFICSTNL